MAHTKSARKRIRQTEKRTAANKTRRSRVRTYVKKVDAAIAAGDTDAAAAALKEAQSELDRGAGKGLLPRRRAARKVSRLTAKIKNLDAPAS